ncbi:MAG: exodeoxyribonuclease III [Helicobacter sp.]|uniref:exodeoxyribonuclease III n=1 Tax=Helicobacter sp. 10-6591 TaxID=2004998 RepID=UPI000DCDB6CB|nr:exodeoxyribonuclease III [Helicobacter sp. 10-6591]MCI6217912.1 exodeoxyribonuclease III [Helicobacter sp.]MCI7485117.1 exodeoxyribonuclease III [Helicobacter sp.]MDD7568183.1 exodeoxyribonuclease III [Helicobacter sp.]MDY5740850.1 exodeoxyribonuclease III [Helicobacter sp.]RAX55045.1 exodeoxyribonuclease III [Helicobacter sp. 10-6591]
MKLVSWNVNGLRACMNKGFMEFFDRIDADVFCIQESKMQPDQATFDFPNYKQYWNSAHKKGYSGVAIFSKTEPLNVMYDMGIAHHDTEGRIITAEYENFSLVNVYTPNSKRELERLEYRMEWENDFRIFVKDLEKSKPVVICGDLNVAHKEIDLKNPKTNRRNAGFTDEEREKFSLLLQSGFIDTFRYFYPDKEGAYTWWSYMGKAREKNTGWRIDYFLCSKTLDSRLRSASIYPEVMGSDHCPVGLEIL